MAEQSWHKRIADFGTRRVTEMQGRLPGAVKVAAFVAGLGAGVAVSAVADVRADGSGLAAVFGPLVGVEVALLAVYVTPLGNAVRPFLGPTAVGAAALGALASVVGLAQPPLDAYRYALGVAGRVHGLGDHRDGGRGAGGTEGLIWVVVVKLAGG